MGLLRLDVLGLLDLLSGILLFFTVSPVPMWIASVHAGFLVFKGAGGMINSIRFPYMVFVLGGFADLISASILYFGQPPVLEAYKVWIAGALFLKGVWSMLALMGR